MSGLPYLYTISGFAVGLLVGMTGVGGGSLMTPILILLFGIHPAAAVGTDLLHAFLVTMAAGLGTILFGVPNYAYVATILIGSIPGILIGSHFTHRLPERALRGSIAGVLALSGLKLLGAF